MLDMASLDMQSLGLGWSSILWVLNVVVVDILVKLLVFHEENPVEQFGGEIIEDSTEADDV